METASGDYHSILLTSIPRLVQQAFTWGDTWELIVFGLLLLGSGFVSGAETAFFSITPPQLMELKDSRRSSGRLIYHLLSAPKRLLATLLILINFINIAIIVLSSLLMGQFIDFTDSPILGFIVQVAVVTFIIVLICEVLPKVYATQNAIAVSHLSVFPIYVADKILRPFTALLVLSTSFIDKRLSQKGYNISVEDLTHAIDITSDINTPEEEKKILKGIARFGNTDVKQIMKPRMDVIAFDMKTKFPDVLAIIRENGYSRIPVFDKTFDHVTGILYIKDLIAFLDQESDEDFNWQRLIRPAYFVPESKKINDLLQEFQEKKMHLAVVVDEYGGSSGIATLEDILEEIVGEISDEFDDEELAYSKLDDKTFVFEGKALINDIIRVMQVDRKLFDMGKEEIDTLAGFILELTGRIPAKNEVVRFNDLVLTIESADKRRIKRVKIEIPEMKNESEESSPGEGSIITPLIVLCVCAMSLFSGCKFDDDFTPRPHGFYRIDLPEKKYRTFDIPSCPFTFSYPAYASVIPDADKYAEPCWMDVVYPQFKATLYLSYKTMHNDLDKYTQDFYTLADKHIPKASGMRDLAINMPQHHVYGVYFEIKGPAASPTQFFVTDSMRHFLRCSLYFYAAPQPDSIAPVLEFLNKDLDEMINSFRWK